VVKLHYYFASIPPFGVPIIVSYTCASLRQLLNCGVCISSIYRHGENTGYKGLSYLSTLQVNIAFNGQHLLYPFKEWFEL